MSSRSSNRRALKVGETVLLRKGSRAYLTHIARVPGPDKRSVFSQFQFDAGGTGVMCYQDKTPLPSGSKFAVGTSPTQIILVRNGRRNHITLETGPQGDDRAYIQNG